MYYLYIWREGETVKNVQVEELVMGRASNFRARAEPEPEVLGLNLRLDPSL